jgi:tripartite-type tricarboxylate transporter receptor subunit TctC
MTYVRIIAMAVLAVLIAGPHATAQPYPEKPVRLVVAFPPGGTTDIIGRLIASKLTERLGQQVLVDNRPGAGGIIGTDAVAKAAPDGYTLLLSSSALATYGSLYQKVPFDSVKDFEPVAMVATTPYALVVHPSLPVKSVAELVSHAKANPGGLNYAASAPGGAQHLGWELFKRSTGTDLLYIPYKGTGALMPDLFAGRLHAGIDNVAVLTQYIKNGSLRGLAVTGAKRSALLPELPTMIEAGVPGFQVTGWFGVFAPANTPAPIVKQLNEAVVEIFKQRAVIDRFAELGAELSSGSQDELRKLLASEIDVWGKVIRDAGIKLD